MFTLYRGKHILLQSAETINLHNVSIEWLVFKIGFGSFKLVQFYPSTPVYGTTETIRKSAADVLFE